jgi:uncharacterized membrane protein
MLVALAPFLPALLEPVPALARGGLWLDAWFRIQCERDPLRSFGGVAVCARCLGLYVGFGVGGAVGRPLLPLRVLQLLVAAGALLLGLDVLSEELGYRPPSALGRVLTGLLLAYPIGLVVRAAVTASQPPAADG